MKITFGTDGWRGVIGDDFSYDNIRRVATAMAKYYRDTSRRDTGDATRVVIGYDTRFLGEEAALTVARVFASKGITPIVASTPIPTPCLSFHVKERKLKGGVMITASHNPAVYNGLKFKAHYGGTATGEIYDRIALHLPKRSVKPPRKQVEVQREEFILPYLDYIEKIIDQDIIRRQGWQIVWDTMHGASDKLFSRLHRNAGFYIKTMHAYPDPRFAGLQPEPIPANLGPLKEELMTGSYDIAFAADGDGDRLGVMLPDGSFVTPHEVFALLALYLLEERGERGGIAKTFSSSFYLDRIARAFEVPLYETGIGFKYLCPFLTEGDVIIAGEESGGLATGFALPERDSLFTASLLLEMLARRRLTLKEALEDLRHRFGTLIYRRDDLPLQDSDLAAERLDGLASSPPESIAGRRVTRVMQKDGTKFIFGDDGWLLLRISGTEPLVRIYCELPTREAVNLTMKEASRWLLPD